MNTAKVIYIYITNIFITKILIIKTKIYCSFYSFKEFIARNSKSLYNSYLVINHIFIVLNNYLKFINGEKVRNKDLLNTMLIKSINNTAKMVASATGMSEDYFVKRINKRLDLWGVASSTIVEVTGLNDNNKSTPKDMLAIFTNVLKNDDIKNILGKNEYSFSELTDKNGIKKSI